MIFVPTTSDQFDYPRIRWNSDLSALPRLFQDVAWQRLGKFVRLIVAQIITVSLYSFRVTHRGKDKDLQNLDKIGGTADLFQILKGLFEGLNGTIVGTHEAVRQLSLPKALFVDENARVIYGNVEVGTSGYGSSIKDLSSGTENYRRKITDSEMLPLHIRFWIPKGEKYGILALQNFGELGCKTLLTTQILSRWDQIKDNNFMLRIREIIPQSVYHDLIHNRTVTKIRLIHHGVPSDIADAYNGKALDPTLGTLELSINSKRGSDLGAKKFVESLFSKGFSPKGTIEIDNFEAHEVKIELKDQDNRKQTVSFADILRVHSRLNVTDQVVLGPEGHPTEESISNICRALIVKTAKEIN